MSYFFNMLTTLDYYHLVTGIKTSLHLLLVTNTDIHTKNYFFYMQGNCYYIYKCLVYVIWTEHQMSDLVLNVCFDVFSQHKISDLKLKSIITNSTILFRPGFHCHIFLQVLSHFRGFEPQLRRTFFSQI
jgi:hypothetical protein